MLFLSACSHSDDASSETSASDASSGAAIGEMCGGVAGVACGAGAYCALEAGACRQGADQAGICRTTPEFCTREYRPVCGCDGETYSNPCVAASAGASIAYDGACRV